jgi:sulfur carrier protein
MIAVYINGERHEFADAPSCAELVTQLQLAGRRLAIERNGEIVPRSCFSSCRLADGDRLEIVAAVGGG